MNELRKGSIVRLNFSVLNDIISDENVLKQIIEFDEEYDKMHMITNIYVKNTYTDNKLYRYELDNDFVFYENELIKL